MRCAMSSLDSPEATRPTTSRSLAVSSASPGGGAGERARRANSAMSVLVTPGDSSPSPEAITRKLIDRYVSYPPPSGTAALERLTNRERQAVTLVAQGCSNEQIAARMTISAVTAKTHINRAMTKLNARDRAQLVVFAYESGLVVPRNS